MGGMGSLRTISERPDFFAATAFCAGRLSDPEKIEEIVNVPTWGFVGTRDRMFQGAMEGVFSELKKLGGNMKLTVCKDVSHQVVYIYTDYSGDNKEKGWTTSYTGDRCDEASSTGVDHRCEVRHLRTLGRLFSAGLRQRMVRQADV